MNSFREMSSLTELELIKSYVKDYFENLDDRIKDCLDQEQNGNSTSKRSKTPNTGNKPQHLKSYQGGM